jgi:hypothetical protein
MPWRNLSTPTEIVEAINRDHIVLLAVDMSKISRDQHPVYACSSDDTCLQISGRYYDFEGRHAIVLKGIVQDSSTGRYYAVVYDPNVWGGNGNYYYLNDQRYPRGLNRLYLFDEVVRAFQATRTRAIEILATPSDPAAMPAADTPDTSTAPARPAIVSEPFWCVETPGEIGGAFWCQE